MKIKIDKKLILESRVITTFKNDGTVVQHHGMEKLPKKVFSSERVSQNKKDIADQIKKQNSKKYIQEDGVPIAPYVKFKTITNKDIK